MPPSMWAEEDALLDAANRTARTPDVDQMAFEALESDAEFDHVLFDAKQFGLNAVTGSDEEQEYLGLPGLLEPDQMAVLLHERQTAQSTRRPRKVRAAGVGAPRAGGPAAGAQQAGRRLRPQEGHARTASCTTSCAAPVVARRSTRRPPSRSWRGSRRSGPGSSAVAESFAPGRGCASRRGAWPTIRLRFAPAPAHPPRPAHPCASHSLGEPPRPAHPCASHRLGCSARRGRRQVTCCRHGRG